MISPISNKPSKPLTRKFRFLLVLSGLIPLLSALSGCAINPASGKADFVLMTENQEIQMGKNNHPKILAQYGVYNDPKLQAYVQRVGQELAKQSDRKDLTFHFTVLDSPQVNAFALPGGYIYITRGIMAYLNSEAELAGVLGHEIGHVTARHGVRQHSASTATGFLGTIIEAKTGQKTISDLSKMLGGALLSGYGRKHELEADRLGAEYITRIGYNPNNMINVIGVLKDQQVFAQDRAKKEGKQVQNYHSLFSTHPKNDKRLKEVINAANNIQTVIKKRHIGRQTYLKAIEGMIFGQSPEQGIVKSNRFYHTSLGFVFDIPQGWSTQNLADRILITDKQQNGLIQLVIDPLKNTTTPEQYLKARLTDTKVIESTSIEVNGLSAHTITAYAKTQLGERPARFTVIFNDKNAYLLTAVVKEANSFSQLDSFFLKTINSFHSITEKERKLAAPLKIHLTKTTKNTTYKMIAKNSILSNYAQAQLRLLNGHYPSGSIKPNTMIKIIK